MDELGSKPAYEVRLLELPELTAGGRERMETAFRQSLDAGLGGVAGVVAALEAYNRISQRLWPDPPTTTPEPKELALVAQWEAALNAATNFAIAAESSWTPGALARGKFSVRIPLPESHPFYRGA